MDVYELPYEVPARGLELSGLFYLLQEAASAQCEGFGWGWEAMRSRGIMWVVTRYQLFVERWPRPGERILARTWPGQTRHGMYLRHFQLLDGTGRLLAAGAAIWAVADRESRRMLQSAQSGVEIPAVVTGEETRMPAAPGKREGEACGRFTADESVLDANGHMNNTRYFDLACCAAGLRRERLRELRVEYAAETRLGDELLLRLTREGDRSFFSGESDRCGVHFRMEWRES